MDIRLENMVEEEIQRRSANAKLMSDNFPELKGLSYVEFLQACPLDLDFITSHEMWEALNTQL